MSELQEKLGALLANERKRQNRSIEDISVDLKISETNIEHIELGDASTLPAPLYFELFAKSYAQVLGIDYDATTRAIADEVGAPDEFLISDTTDKPSDSAEKPAPLTGDSPDAESAGKSFKKVGYIVGGATLLLVLLLLANWYFLPESQQLLPELSPNSTAHLNDQQTDDAQSSRLASYNWDTPDYVPSDSISIVLTARNESWVGIEVDGDLRFSKILGAGEVRSYRAAYRVKVSVGIPSRVDIQLDGQAVDLRSPRGRINNIEITQLNRAEILAGTPPLETPNSRVTRPPEPEATTPVTTPRQTAPQRAPGSGSSPAPSDTPTIVPTPSATDGTSAVDTSADDASAVDTNAVDANTVEEGT